MQLINYKTVNIKHYECLYSCLC